MTGVVVECPDCGVDCKHHMLDLYRCYSCGRFWDTDGQVRADEAMVA
jgi:uncharacterized Zn finger protein